MRLTYYKDLWSYDPAANTWTRKQDHPNEATTAPLGFGTTDRGYMITREATTGLTTTWAYEPVANSWSKVAAFPGKARDGGLAVGVGGTGYIGTGAADRQALNDWWSYVPPAQIAVPLPGPILTR